MTRIPRIAAALVVAGLFSGCTTLDIVLWSTEGGTVEIDSHVSQLADCSVWNADDAMATDCEDLQEYVCEDNDEGVEVCSADIGSISTTDLPFDSTLAVLKATPDDGYVFAGWDGCEGSGLILSDDGSECSVYYGGGFDTYQFALAQTEADANVVATFEAE